MCAQRVPDVTHKVPDRRTHKFVRVVRLVVLLVVGLRRLRTNATINEEIVLHNENFFVTFRKDIEAIKWIKNPIETLCRLINKSFYKYILIVVQ